MSKKDLPLLKSLTDSIKKGERVVLLPPGIFLLISVIGLSIAAIVLISGVVIHLFFSTISTPMKASIQFGSMGIFLVFVVFPALMLFLGKKHFASWHRWFSIFLFTVSFFLLIFDFLNQGIFFKPLLGSLIASGLAWFTTNTAGYILFTEFFHLLKQR